jgi:hypothetical protein
MEWNRSILLTGFFSVNKSNLMNLRGRGSETGLNGKEPQIRAALFLLGFNAGPNPEDLRDNEAGTYEQSAQTIKKTV